MVHHGGVVLRTIVVHVVIIALVMTIIAHQTICTPITHVVRNLSITRTVPAHVVGFNIRIVIVG